MTDRHIDDLIQNLSWTKEKSVQEEAVEELKSISDLDLTKLINLPSNLKEYMDNAAQILSTCTFERVETVIMELYRWLQDLNWPGAITILNLLSDFPKEKTIQYFEKAVTEAIEMNDESWLDNLSYFTRFSNYSYEDFDNKELFGIMKKHADFMWSST